MAARKSGSTSEGSRFTDRERAMVNRLVQPVTRETSRFSDTERAAVARLAARSSQEGARFTDAERELVNRLTKRLGGSRKPSSSNPFLRAR